MAQVKNNIFDETSKKKNNDGIINISVDIEKVRDDIKNSSVSSIFASSELYQKILNEVMKYEMETFLDAKKSERTEKRKGYRNGSYIRSLATSIGKLNLQVPRDRNGEFQTTVFERFNRVEKAFCATLIEMVLDGVSTRKIKDITEILCGTSFSHSTVSKIVKTIQPYVDEFQTRPIVGVHKYVHVDAMYIDVREGNKVVKKSVYIALGYNNDGRKTILGYEIANSENKYEYINFLTCLKEKGLINPKLFITDNNESLKTAIKEVFPNADWQYCAAHLFRNTLNNVANKYKKQTGIMLQELKKINDYKFVNKGTNVLMDFLVSNKQYKAMKSLDDWYQYSFKYLEFNPEIHRCIFTNNALERVNCSIRKREKIIKIFPNVESANRLIGAILMQIDEDFMTGNQNLAMVADLAQI